MARAYSCVAARAFGPSRLRVNESSLVVSRAAKLWQGRSLKGSGHSIARFWTPAVVAWKGRYFWSRRPRNLGRGVL